MIVMSDLHWAAGFLEGEGCFMALHNKRRLSSYWMPVVDASQVNKEPLQRMHGAFGGRLSLVKAKGKRQEFLVWRLHGRRAIAFMMTIWLLMSERRREQIELAIERWKENQGHKGVAYLASRPRGERNGNTKLTVEAVKEIRVSSNSQRELAQRYSVSELTIANVRNRKVWAHVE